MHSPFPRKEGAFKYIDLDANVASTNWNLALAETNVTTMHNAKQN